MKTNDYNLLFFSKTNEFLNTYFPLQIIRSEHTVKAYKIALNDFFNYIQTQTDFSPVTFRFEDCTHDLVLKYSEYIQHEMNYCPVTVNQKLSALKSYLKYASGVDPSLLQVYVSISTVPLLRIEKKIRPYLEPDELATFLACPPNNYFGNRDKMLLVFLYDTAMRVGEVTRVTLGDINLNLANPKIRIYGKGRKERIVDLSDSGSQLLKKYIQIYHGNSSLSTPLFYTKIHGVINSMSDRNIEKIVSKYSRIAQEENPDFPKVYPHMLRSTRASLMLQDGIPINIISTFLGHEDIETTRIYAYPSSEQMRAAANAGVSEASTQNDSMKSRKAETIEEIKRRFGLA